MTQQTAKQEKNLQKNRLKLLFPSQWKEAVITPVLKKGNPELVSNYWPVSCLPAASKVLVELVVCTQMSEYLEKNNFLPKKMHGFRA